MSNAATRDAPPGSYVANYATGTLDCAGVMSETPQHTLAGAMAICMIIYAVLLHLDTRRPESLCCRLPRIVHSCGARGQEKGIM